MANITDFILTPVLGVLKVPNPSVWVRLRNNASATDYYSTAVTDPNTGQFTVSNIPPDDYSLYSGVTATVGGTPTLINPHYRVGYTAGDDAALRSTTDISSGSYASTAKAGFGKINGSALGFQAAATLVYDNFTRADGALGTSPSGDVWTVSGAAPPTISANKLKSTGVGYAMLDNGVTPAALGCTLVWNNNGAGVGNSTMICSIDAGIGLLNMIHWQIGTTTWTLQKRTGGGSFINIANGTYATPLTADGVTEYKAVMAFVGGNTIYLFPPDGTIQIVTDAAVATLTGPRCIWEPLGGAGAKESWFTSAWVVTGGGSSAGFPTAPEAALTLQDLANMSLVDKLQAQTIAGVKTFSSRMLITAVPPVSTTQAALMVDSSAGFTGGLGAGTLIGGNIPSGGASLMNLQNQGVIKVYIDGSGNAQFVTLTATAGNIKAVAGTFQGDNSGSMYLDAVGVGGSVNFRSSNGGANLGNFDSTGKLTTVGALLIGSRPAFVAADKYLVVDASGNVHVSALGPAS
jgi:hypothetical protein